MVNQQRKFSLNSVSLTLMIAFIFSIILLFVDISGLMDIIDLQNVDSIIAFLAVVSISCLFIVAGVVFGKKIKDQFLWGLIGGLVGLAIYITTLITLIIWIANVST